MSDELFMWKDKRVEELTREELISALKHMIRESHERFEQAARLARTIEANNQLLRSRIRRQRGMLL